MNTKSEFAGIGPTPLDPYAVSLGQRTLTLVPIVNCRPT
jgi:hypothetical protein